MKQKVYSISGFDFWYDQSAKGYVAVVNGKEIIAGKDKQQAEFYLTWLSNYV